MTSLLAKEILQKEEMLLKETKIKLLEQLNRLKVEEVALERHLLDIIENQPEENIAEVIENNSYQTTSSHNKDSLVTYEEDVNTLNQMPLENLKLSDTKQMNQDTEEEEEEEEEEEDQQT